MVSTGCAPTCGKVPRKVARQVTGVRGGEVQVRHTVPQHRCRKVAGGGRSYRLVEGPAAH